MSGFTEEQIAHLSAKLDRKYVTDRPHAGRKLSYIEAWHAIAEANRIFGFDAWNRETVEMREVDARQVAIGQESRQGFRVSYVARVRIEVIAGERRISRDGTGFGQGIDRDIGLAHESGVKEAESDAMKRALMTFGNPFGLALYDKKQENVESVADTVEMPQGFVKGPAERVAELTAHQRAQSGQSSPDPITITTDRKLGPPQRRRSVSRETPIQEAEPGDDQGMVQAPRLVDLATQAANKGMWALQEFWKALGHEEKSSIKAVLDTHLKPIATAVDEKRNMQPRIDAELASRELADQEQAREQRA